MLISLYVLIPILKAIIKDNIGYYIVALWIFFEITTNTIEFWYPTTHILKIFYIREIDYIGYFILGYLIYHNQYNFKKYPFYILGSIFMLAAIVLTMYYSQKILKLNESFFDNLTLFVLMPAVAIFLLFQKKIIKEKHQKYIQILSNISLGIYLIHPMILELISKLITIDASIINVLILWISTLIFSIICTYILAHIPFVKKLVK